jgi:hypothetical protein
MPDKDAIRESKYPGMQARNGSSLNPPAREKRVGFDSRVPSERYDPNLFSALPIRMRPGDALVSTISRRNEEITRFAGQQVDPLRVAAVLCCVAQPQPADAFRPSYCDSSNSPVLLARDLRRSSLLRLPRPASAPPNLRTYAGQFSKPWLDIAEFGFAAPVDNLPHYGQFIAQLVGEAGLLLMMDYSASEKEALLVNLVQVGIDFYGLARAGGSWPAHGGLNSGRKFPIMFAGIMLGRPDMQSPLKSASGAHFAEDDQTAFCPYEYKGRTFARGWTGARAIFTGHSLEGTGGERGSWEKGWGPVDLFPPTEWPRRPSGDYPQSESYRRANTSGAWVGEALAMRLIHAEKAWGHDAFFAYVDRWMTEDDTPFLLQMKAAGYPDLTAKRPGSFERQGFVWGPRFVAEMWNKYRNRIPPAEGIPPTPPAGVTWK